MRRPFGLLCCLFPASFVSSPAVAADGAPERLLAKESVAYVRFDGVARHRDAFGKTSLAKVIDEEYQPLIDAVSKMIYDALGPSVLSNRLLNGVRPAELIKLQKAVRQLPRFANLLKQHGFAVGVEVISPMRGKFQVTFVFPEGADKATAGTALGGFD